MSRRPPPDTNERRAYVEENGLVSPGTRVFDPAVDQFAVVLGHTERWMTRIQYEKPDARRLYGETKLVNPTRLRLPVLQPRDYNIDEDGSPLNADNDPDT